MQKHFTVASFLLALAVFITVPQAKAQFNIKVPKLPKIVKDQPQRPVEPEQPSTNSRSGGDPTVAAVSARQSSAVAGGRAIPGAKVVFSATPFTNSSAGARSSFASSEFIYGRLELDRSISDAFGLGNLPNRDYYYIRYHVIIGGDDGS